MIDKPGTWTFKHDVENGSLQLSCNLEDGTNFNIHMFYKKSLVPLFVSLCDRLNHGSDWNSAIDAAADAVADETEPPLAHRADLAKLIRGMKI